MKQLLFFLFVCSSTYAQAAQDSLTAEEILDRSIEFCGGYERLDKIQTSSMVYDITTKDNLHGSMIQKREQGKNYMSSLLSNEVVSNSTHYNGSVLIVIEGELETVVKEAEVPEETKLLTFVRVEFAYKKLGYILQRLPDQKFESFDCYTLVATRKGYTTINYFDKTDFRLIMTVYPRGNKSILIDYQYQDSILYNPTVVTVDNKQQMTWNLRSAEINKAIDPLWFNVEAASKVSAPEYVRVGKYRDANGVKVVRTKKNQTETMAPHEIKTYLSWFNSYIFVLTPNAPSAEPIKDKGWIMVKVISWNKKKYVCHYAAEKVSGTQDYIIEE